MDMPKVKAERSVSLAGEAVAKIASEPVFCFEVGPPSASSHRSAGSSPCVHIWLAVQTHEQVTKAEYALQTSLKMLYWSKLMYAYEEVRHHTRMNAVMNCDAPSQQILGL